MRKILIGLVVATLLAVSWVATSSSVDAAAPRPPIAPVTGHFVPDGPDKPVPYGLANAAHVHWTWGWVTGTVYLNRLETSKLTLGASVSGIIGAAVGIAAVGGTFATLAAYAAYVFRQGHCVKFKIYPGFPYPLAVPGEYWGTSGGGYCR